MNTSYLIETIQFYAHDPAPERITRLEKTAIYIIAYGLGCRLIAPLSTPITAMEDCKGSLIISWVNASARDKLEKVSCDAWELVGREPRNYVYHLTESSNHRSPDTLPHKS